MKGHVFNIDNGYLEGLCRGFKNGILRQGDYLNLVQCETLEGKVFFSGVLLSQNG
jgi:V-type H+-transporting ATPase subunit d